MIDRVHKYLRRLIVWAQTPSDEEWRERQLRRMQIQQQDDHRRLLNALRTGWMPCAWKGYDIHQGRRLVNEAWTVVATNSLKGASVDRFITELAGTLGVSEEQLRDIDDRG